MVESSSSNLSALREQLLALRQRALDVERIGEDEIALVHPSRRSAARNLVDYLALRQQDISGLQRDLQRHGFSSLGVIQGHVMASIDAVLGVLDTLSEQKRASLNPDLYPTIEGALAALRTFADETLGHCPRDGSVRIMVTMPSEAAVDPGIIDHLLEQGMSVMRVNCAHDGPDAWSAMIEHLRRAEQKHGRVCRISFDLAGPKLRTGPIAVGPEVRRFKPTRDNLGRVSTPGTIAFGPASEDAATLVPLSAHLHQRAKRGDVLRFDDARGRDRELPVDNVGRHSLLCTTDRTVYLTTGTPIELWRGDECLEKGEIGKLPPLESSISLKAGDTLIVTRELSPGRPAVVDDDDLVIEPARIGCSLPSVFTAIRVAPARLSAEWPWSNSSPPQQPKPGCASRVRSTEEPTKKASKSATPR